MIIDYSLYRAKNDEEFNGEKIEVLLQDDRDLVVIDTIMQRVLMQHMNSLDQVKRFGIAYVGRMEILSVEINDKDNISLNENAFRQYFSTISKAPVIWKRSKDIKYKEVEEGGPKKNVKV